MHITRAISYGNAWNDLNDKYPDALEDIRNTAALMTPKNIRAAKAPLHYPVPRDTAGQIEHWKFDGCWEAGMLSEGWRLSAQYLEGVNGREIPLRNLGTILDPVSVTFLRHRETLNRWLFTLAPIATRRGLVEIPVAVVMLPKVEATIRERKVMTPSDVIFDRTLDELKALSPLSHSEPFLILGVDLQATLDEQIDVTELASETGTAAANVIINRSIEFPPEYHQAGLGILNYFGTVLREKCPDENATVTIEQDGLIVRLVIESENGNREVIEKALQEYQMVIQGQMKPEDLFESKLKVIELKSELRVAQVRIDTQQDLIQHQRLELNTLRHLVTLALERPAAASPVITVSPIISISNHQTTVVQMQESMLRAAEEMQELADLAGEDPSVELRLRDLEEALKLSGKRETPEAVKESGGLLKLKKLLDDANEAGTSINSFFTKLSEGADALQKLARRYNGIAEWCGAPTVPRIFLGKDT